MTIAVTALFNIRRARREEGNQFNIRLITLQNTSDTLGTGMHVRDRNSQPCAAGIQPMVAWWRTTSAVLHQAVIGMDACCHPCARSIGRATAFDAAISCNMQIPSLWLVSVPRLLLCIPSRQYTCLCFSYSALWGGGPNSSTSDFSRCNQKLWLF